MRRYSRPIIPERSIIKKILKAIRIGKRLIPLTPIERTYLEAISFTGYILENTEDRYIYHNTLDNKEYYVLIREQQVFETETLNRRKLL